MNSKPVTLSVILPVYNVAEWLEECLNSIFQQTRPADEIIAVDDGSTDNSYEVLARYAEMHPQLKIIRQENGGLSVARNSGILASSGTYLIFIDSDDFIEVSMFAKLLKMATTNELDMVLCNGWYYFDNNNKKQLINTDIKNSPVVTGREWLSQRLINKKIVHMVWMHLYRLEFLRENDFQFIPGQVHEDIIWTNQVLLSAKRVQYIDDPLYYYRIRQIRTGADQMRRSREYVIPCSVTNTETLIKMADKIEDNSQLSQLMRWQAVDSGFAVFHLIEKLPSRKVRLQIMDHLWNTHFYHIMWKNSVNFRQKKKMARLIICKLTHWT